MAGSSARKQLLEQVDAVEGAYEFFLAYAAQGLRKDAGDTSVVRQFRRHLGEAIEAVRGLAGSLGALIEKEKPEGREQLAAFRDVLEVDATRAAVVLEVVQGQSFPTSQIVDNLNASVHIRTLLTDLFLLDEALDLGVDRTPGARAAVEPQTSDASS